MNVFFSLQCYVFQRSLGFKVSQASLHSVNLKMSLFQLFTSTY